MSLIILETGAKVPYANCYISVAEADTYHTTYGNTDWTDLPASAENTTLKEQALIQATQSIELLYGQKYLSFPQTIYQPGTTLDQYTLLFPRFLLIINRIQLVQALTIPYQLRRAVAEVALMKIQGADIFPLPNTDNWLTSKDLSISGGPSKKVQWSKNPFTEMHAGFNKIELLLKPLLRRTESPLSMSF